MPTSVIAAAAVAGVAISAKAAYDQKRAASKAEQTANRQQRKAEAEFQAEQRRTQEAKDRKKIEDAARARKAGQAARSVGQRGDILTSPLGIVPAPAGSSRKELLGL